MVKRLFYAALFLLISILGGVQPGIAAELVGLQNLALEPGDRVWGFNIRLNEGRIIAVCNIPEGWKISAENYGEAADYKDGGSEVQGSADFGHDALSVTGLSRLRTLVLIDRSTVHGKPAILSGDVTIVGLSDNRKITLELRNFIRRKAEQCPALNEQKRRTRRSSGY